MVSVKKIVMVTLVAVTMLGLGGLFPHAEACFKTGRSSK